MRFRRLLPSFFTIAFLTFCLLSPQPAAASPAVLNLNILGPDNGVNLDCGCGVINGFIVGPPDFSITASSPPAFVSFNAGPPTAISTGCSPQVCDTFTDYGAGPLTIDIGNEVLTGEILGGAGLSEVNMQFPELNTSHINLTFTLDGYAGEGSLSVSVTGIPEGHEGSLTFSGTATPEPNTLLLLVSGIGILAAISRARCVPIPQ